MSPIDAPKFRTRTAKEVVTGLVRRGGSINEGACGVVTDEKHAEFGRTVYNVWFPRDPKYPVWDDNCNFRITESKDGFVSMEADFRLSGMHGDAHVTKHFTIPSNRSRQGTYAWDGVDMYLALFRRLRSTTADEVISQSSLQGALTLLWWGMDQAMKNAAWNPSDFEPLRKAWSEVAPLWTPPRDDDELPDYVRNTLDIPWPEEEHMPRTSRPTTSSITEEVRTERKITVTLSAADIDAALIEWAKKNLSFNPPEGASIQIDLREEGNDDNGNHGEPAYATLTVDMVTKGFGT